MRGSHTLLVISLAGALALPAMAQTSPHHIGTGFEYDVVTGEGDDGIGAYLFYEYDWYDPIAVRIETSYVTGDYDVESGSGDYETIGLGGAFIFHFDMGEWEPYVGAGGANQFNDFDTLDYDDKLSIFWLGGARFPISDRMSADVSLRYRSLRIDSLDPNVKPDPIDMDAWVLRAGVTFDL